MLLFAEIEGEVTPSDRKQMYAAKSKLDEFMKGCFSKTSAGSTLLMPLHSRNSHICYSDNAWSFSMHFGARLAPTAPSWVIYTFDISESRCEKKMQFEASVEDAYGKRLSWGDTTRFTFDRPLVEMLDNSVFTERLKKHIKACHRDPRSAIHKEIGENGFWLKESAPVRLGKVIRTLGRMILPTTPTKG